MPTAEISPLQLIANQLNAQKSTGPRTESGKNIAKFNARRHGLTGQFFCMSEGDEIAWNGFQTNILSDLKPVGAYETQLAISVAQDQWRLNRSRGIEHNLYGQGHDEFADTTAACSPNVQAASTMADTFREGERTFANIALYETRIHRMIAKNEKRLKELQAERKAAEAEAREEAELITRLALMKGETLDRSAHIQANGAQSNVRLVAREGLIPTHVEANGFVFSTAEIIAKINRDETLREARHYQKHQWDRTKTCPPPAPLPKAA
jgi:hypothetical protein